MRRELGIIGSLSWQIVMQVVCLGVGIYIAWLYIRPFSWGAFLLLCGINIVILEVALGLISVILVYVTVAIWSVLRSNTKGKVASETDQISEAYKQQWNNADSQHRREIVWRIYHWQKLMEDGLAPEEARMRANELNYELSRSLPDLEANA